MTSRHVKSSKRTTKKTPGSFSGPWRGETRRDKKMLVESHIFEIPQSSFPPIGGYLAEKRKVWNLHWGTLSWMADMSAQQPVTCFSLDLWMSFVCRSMGASIPMFQAHAVARTICSCENFSFDPQGDHVLACKKQTGEPPEATIMLWMSWHNWPARQVTLCTSTTRCQRQRPQQAGRCRACELWS